MIQRCLIVDTETTGLDPATDAVLEIGAILYDVKHQTSLVQFSTLTERRKENPAESINRIPSAALLTFTCPVDGSAIFGSLIAAADAIVAHNAEFDASFLSGGDWTTKPWLCTKSDFRWPRQSRESPSLVSLALDHGIGVSSAHRALTDCRLIAALFDRMPSAEGGYELSLQQMFSLAMRPRATYQALVSYDDREKAKAAGFAWDPAKKRWTRRMAIEDATALPFKTVMLP